MERVKVAESSRCLAEKYLAEGNFGRAFAHYLVVLKVAPQWKSALKENFSKSLCEWGLILEKGKRFQDLFNCYEQALDVFPENEFVLNNVGAHLMRCGYINEAVHYFRQCLRRNPQFVRAARNVDSALYSAVERWHFRMLNDSHRNEAFRRAIQKIIRRGFDRVLDIGTGTGILSLFCVEGKAKEIYACESSFAMIETAREVFRRNSTPEVRLLEKCSTELQVPRDIPRKVSFVVAEIVDSGLLGEGILQTLDHAWNHLLLPPWPGPPYSIENFGFVVPYAADLYIAGIECDDIFDESYLKNMTRLFHLGHCDASRIRKDYDTKNLQIGRFKILTNIEKVIRINFNRPDILKEILEGRHNKDMKLIVQQAGRLDCLAVWFDLFLDEEISHGTGPYSESNSAWDQAIFFPPRYRVVQELEEISIRVSFEKDKLNVHWTEEGGQRFLLSEDTVKILNDKNLMDSLGQVVSELMESFSRPLHILDCYSFPVFGLGFLTQRKEKFDDKLTCVVPREEDRKFVDFIAKQNHIQNITIMKGCHFDENLPEDKKFDVILMDIVEQSGDLKDGVVHQMQLLRKVQAVVEKKMETLKAEMMILILATSFSLWLLRRVKKLKRLTDLMKASQRFRLSQQLKASSADNHRPMEYLHQIGKLLKAEGRFLPQDVEVWGQLLYCEWVLKASKVINNEVTCGFVVAEFLNKYQTRHFVDLDLKNLTKTWCCSPFRLFSLYSPESSFEVTINCAASAPPPNAMVYWYKITLTDSSVFTTGDSLYHQAGFLLDNDNFKRDIKFNVFRDNGLFYVDFPS